MKKNEKENKETLTVFLDTIGRTILGALEAEDSNSITIKNPAVVNITPNPTNGQISLQLLPLFFREFLADSTEPTKWVYQKSLITRCQDITLDFKFLAQYGQIFSPIQAQQAESPKGDGNVIKLFDE